jgi:nucleoside-diphosphate-sugar epimerase
MLKILGNGLIANCFKFEKFEKNIFIFASGVSDSSTVEESQFQRELSLIKSQILENKNYKIVYFSSIFLQDRQEPYYQHKFKVEELIKSSCIDYLIIRLPQIVGIGGNDKNIFNYFKNIILSDKLVEIYSETTRSLIDIEDLKSLVIFCIKNDQTGIVNFSTIECLEVIEIARIMSEELGKKLIYEIIQRKTHNIVLQNSDVVEKWIEENNIERDEYTKKLIKKYCHL